MIVQYTFFYLITDIMTEELIFETAEFISFPLILINAIFKTHHMQVHIWSILKCEKRVVSHFQNGIIYLKFHFSINFPTTGKAMLLHQYILHSFQI